MTSPYGKAARTILSVTCISLLAWAASAQVAPHGVIKLKDSSIEYFPLCLEQARGYNTTRYRTSYLGWTGIFSSILPMFSRST
jgi:hypothetical protein